MERTAGDEVGPRPLQLDVAVDHIDDVDAAQEVLDKSARDHGRWGARPIGWPERDVRDVWIEAPTMEPL